MKREHPAYPSFFITVSLDGKSYRLKVVQTSHGLGLNRYEVQARNRTLVFDNNQPVLERKGLKHFPWTWTLVSGTISRSFHQEAITRAIELYLKTGKQESS